MISAKIPFFLWGGDQNLDTKLTHTLVSQIDLLFMIKWAKKWCDNSEFTSFVEKGGIAWLDIPIPNSEYRLHMRPYFSRERNERSSLYFLGLFIPANEMNIFGNYLNLLESIHSLTLKEVMSSKNDSVTVTSIATKNSTAMNNLEESEKIQDAVLKGEYKSLVARLRVFFDMETRASTYGSLVIACNPPEKDEAFTSILITRDFYYQNMNFEKRSTELPPQPPPRTESNIFPSVFSTPLKIKNINKIKLKFAVTSILTGLLIVASIFLVRDCQLSTVFHKTETAGIVEMESLKEFLKTMPSHENRISLSFAQIEIIMGGKLPLSQRNAAWWNRLPKNMQAQLMSAGFNVRAVDKNGGYVELTRISNK